MAERPRILLFSVWPVFFSMQGGGGTPIKADLLDGLTAAGFAIDAVLPAGGRESEQPPVHVHVHRLGRVRIPRTTYLGRWLALIELTLRYVFRALRVARANGKPVAVYGLAASTLPAAAVCGRLFRRPSIGVLLGTFLYPVIGSRRERRANFEEVLAFKTPVTRLVMLDDGTRGDDVARALGVPDERLRFWMHGIDEAATARALAAGGTARERLGLPADAPLVVSASRLTKWKGVDRAIEAMVDVVQAVPDALLVVTGDGPSEEELRALAARLGVDGSVIFTGPLGREENLELIAAADVFVALYDYSSVGVSLLEAMSCGVPPVVSDAGATRNYVSDGEDGFVIPGADPAGAADAIRRLLEDGDLRARLGRAARERAAGQFLTREARAGLELAMLAELGVRP